MSERLDIMDTKVLELHRYVQAIPWKEFIDHGWVKIKITDGKPTLTILERSDRVNSGR